MRVNFAQNLIADPSGRPAQHRKRAGAGLIELGGRDAGREERRSGHLHSRASVLQMPAAALQPLRESGFRSLPANSLQFGAIAHFIFSCLNR